MEVIWTNLARRSLSNIVSYILDTFDYATAYRVYNGTLNFVEDTLRLMPRIGIRVDDFPQCGELRRAVLKRNSIYYVIEDEKIIVIVVWNGRQDPRRLKALMNQYIKNSKK